MTRKARSESPSGSVIASPEEILETALTSVTETFEDLVGEASEDLTRVLQELETFLAAAIINGDEDAISDYEVILSGVLEINEIKASKAVRKSMLTALTSTARLGLSLVSGFTV